MYSSGNGIMLQASQSLYLSIRGSVELHLYWMAVHGTGVIPFCLPTIDQDGN